MHKMLAVALLIPLSLAIAACDSDDSEEDTSDPTATTASSRTESSDSITPSTTESAEATPLTFEKFAVQIEDAIESSSTDFFVENAILTDFECPNELLGDCGDGPEPTIIQSLVLARWRSEGVPATEAEFEAELADYFAKNPRLLALAVKDTDGAVGAPTHFAVAAADGDPESTGVFAYREEGGEYRLQYFMLAPVLGEEWTSGTCTECYDQWDPW